LLNTVLGSLSSGVPPITGSYESIQTYTATGVESNITFSSIVGTYKHLQLRTLVKDAYILGSATSSLCSIQFNATGGTSYSDHYLKGDGSSATAGGTASTAAIATVFSSTYGPTTSTFAVSIIDIIDYASTTKYKTVRGVTGANFNTTGTDFQIVLGSGLFMSTSAITSIKLLPAISAFGAGSTFALYGIKG
jgi:hypothetical protein